MNRVNKPLIFRNRQFGGLVAQRDFVKYEIHRSRCSDNPDEGPYYVTRWDTKNCDHISTNAVRRFKDADSAKLFCQDLYDGKIDVTALKAEIQAITDAARAEHASSVDSNVAHFKEHISASGLTVPSFMDALDVWNDLMEDARRALYEEKEENTNV